MLVILARLQVTSKHMYGIIVLFRSVASVNKYSIRLYSKNKTQRLLGILANMPKANSARIADAQRQRQLISKKGKNYGSSIVYLQVLGSGARGAPNTLYLFTDQKRYLFNCGESTQRLAHEHKVKLTRLDHIFITSKTWRNLGGLPGLSLTLQDVGVPNITLHGPDGLDELYTATRRFVIMTDMNVTMAKCSPGEDFIDNVMTVKYVLLRPENVLQPDLNPIIKKPKLSNNPNDKVLAEFTHDDTDYYHPDVKNTTKKNNNIKDKAKSSPEKDTAKQKIEKMLNDLQGSSKCTVAYICTLKKRLGTLDLEKCVEKGVKPGPMLGQLKNGLDVILPDGTVVRSKDVKTPDDPGPVFIVLEVPDISYLQEHEFSAHFDNGVNPKELVPSVVVHYTPPHVLRHPTYRAFMSMFGPATRHLVLNEGNSCLGSEAVHRSQHRLHQLDARVFPLLRDVSVPAVWDDPPAAPAAHERLDRLRDRIALAQFENIISMKEGNRAEGDGTDNPEDGKLNIITGRTLTMFHLRPKKDLDRSAEPKLHIQEYIQESMGVEGFAKSLQQFHELAAKVRAEGRGAGAEYPRVVFLGTGSCIPSKTRNTSGIVLQIDESRSMLLDCGEGTFGQLVRFYGPKRVNAFLRTLKAVYVSHLHADHHIGLIGVLQARRQAFEEVDSRQPYQPLHLLAPGQIVTWLSLYDHQFERIRDDFVLVPNQTMMDSKCDLTEGGLPAATLADLGLARVTTCLVAHCPNAFGVAVELRGGHKITYSGDTIPCDELARIGKGSTLLIHEATMEDELAEEARAKMHSTTSQAIEAGRRMGARCTLLTHFSQRYARVPRLGPRALDGVGVAFDNMQVTMDDLPLLPHMHAPLQLMFAEHCVDLELKAANRAKRANRGAPSTSTVGGPTAASSAQTTQHHTGSRHGSRSSSTVTANCSKSVSPVKVLSSVTTKLNRDSSTSRAGVQSRLWNNSAPNNNSPNQIISGFKLPATAVVTNIAIKRPKQRAQVWSKRDLIVTSVIAHLVMLTLRGVFPSIWAHWASQVIVMAAGVLCCTAAASYSGEGRQRNGLFGNVAIARVRGARPVLERHIPNVSSSQPPANVSNVTTKTLNRSPIVHQSFIDARPRFTTSPRIQIANNSREKIPPDVKNRKIKSPSNESRKTKLNNTKQNPCKKKEAKDEMKPFTRRRQIEMLKSSFCREVQQLSNAVNVTSTGATGYRPGLEDIQSSSALLNKRTVINRNIEGKVKNVHEKSPPNKPEPLNEYKRRELLTKAKEKYQSKMYWDESRFTRIEGLNWISWR